MHTRHSVCPGCGCAETVLTPCLTGAVMKGLKVQGRLVSWTCELFTARIVVLGSQLFSAAGNTEIGFSDIFSIAFIIAWQSFIKERACQG